jgi:protein ImuB
VRDSAPLATGRRIVALWFPYWAGETTQIAYDKTQSFALIERSKNAQRLVGLTPLAAQQGLRLGLSLADARALLPDLQTAMAEPREAAARLQKCAYWLQRYTPWVGHDPPSDSDVKDYGLLLDVSGCAHLFGGERALLADMQARFLKRGITAHAAMAGTVGAAWGLVRFGATAKQAWRQIIVPEGQEGEAVLPLPPAALRLSGGHIDLCQRLGLATIGDLAGFARRELTRRFGPAPVLRLEQALGQAGESLNPCLPPPRFLVRHNLAHGVTQMQALAQLIADLCTRLAVQLQKASHGAQRLDLALTRSDNAVLALSLPLAHPCADGAHMARLFEERLSRLARGVDAGYGFEHLSLAASRTAPIVQPQETMGAFEDSPRSQRRAAPIAALGGLYDRLVSRLGAQVVVRPVPHASYIPERAVKLVPVLTPEQGASDKQELSASLPDPATRPLFMLSAPEPIEVIAEIPEGAPYRFRWRRVRHEITAAYGPERISPEWWAGLTGDTPAHHNRQTRDYYRLEDTQGHRFWVYRDGLYERETTQPRWFMHGVFP